MKFNETLAENVANDTIISHKKSEFYPLSLSLSL